MLGTVIPGRVRSPIPRRNDPSTVGVSDLAGGTIMGDVTSIGEGPFAGRSFIYTAIPWGQLVFLAHDSDGTAYAKSDPEVALFSPLDLPVTE